MVKGLHYFLFITAAILAAGCSLFRLGHTNPFDPSYVGGSSSGQTDILPAGLIAYYPFNGNAENAQGNTEYDGIVGTVFQTNDRFNSPSSAYYFNGSNSYIYFGLPTNSTGVYTWIFWSKDASVNVSNRIWLTTSPESQKAGQLVIGEDDTVGGTLFFNIGVMSNKSVSLSAWKDSNWHMHALSSDGTNTRYYFDAVLSVTAPYCEGHEGGLYAGGFTYVGDHHFFNGMIDDIRIFSNALSENEIFGYFHENGW